MKYAMGALITILLVLGYLVLKPETRVRTPSSADEKRQEVVAEVAHYMEESKSFQENVITHPENQNLSAEHAGETSPADRLKSIIQNRNNADAQKDLRNLIAENPIDVQAYFVNYFQLHNSDENNDEYRSTFETLLDTAEIGNQSVLLDLIHRQIRISSLNADSPWVQRYQVIEHRPDQLLQMQEEVRTRLGENANSPNSNREPGSDPDASESVR